MSEAMFDTRSWNRALGPTLRATGYFAAGILVLVLAYYLLYFLAGFAGLQNVIFYLFAYLGPFVIIVYFLLCIFKVLDEELQ